VPPTYEYECDACEHHFEEFQNMSDPLLRKCPACGKRRLLRLLGAGAGIIFKGSGFYETDYRKKTGGPAKEPGSEPGSKPDSKSETKPDSKSESKSESKPESKSESKGDSRSDSKSGSSKGGSSKPGSPKRESRGKRD
jgi:putative FmdB family regulatory protein